MIEKKGGAKGRRLGIATLALLLAVCGLLLCAAITMAETGAQEGRLGWHEEIMPDGLERGEVEGDYVWQKDGSVMVYVPPGEFPRGSEDGETDERPVRQIYLDGFYIDKYEVTWKQWRASGLPLPLDIDGRPIKHFKPDWGRGDDLPVSYIKWKDTQAYCDWVGKRLPTEAEWEKAARGTDGRTYPWGEEEPSFDHAVWNEHPIGRLRPASVTCCEDGASPYGVFNMAGNIFEWVLDYYDPAFYEKAPAQNPVNLVPTEDGLHSRVLRGGAFVLEIEDLRAALRNRQPAIEGQDYVGFRTVIFQDEKSRLTVVGPRKKEERSSQLKRR